MSREPHEMPFEQRRELFELTNGSAGMHQSSAMDQSSILIAHEVSLEQRQERFESTQGTAGANFDVPFEKDIHRGSHAPHGLNVPSSQPKRLCVDQVVSPTQRLTLVQPSVPRHIEPERPVSPRSLRSGARTSPRAKAQTLGNAYSAEILQTQLLNQSISNTIDMDKAHLLHRADDGISPSFLRFPERRSFSELPTSQCEDLTGERKFQLSQDCLPKLLTSAMPNSSQSSTTSRLESPRRSPKSQARSTLASAYSAEVLTAHMLKQAIGETIHYDKKYISARVSDGVSPSFNRLPERQAYRELPSSQCANQEDRKQQLAQDCLSKPRSALPSSSQSSTSSPRRSPRAQTRTLGNSAAYFEFASSQREFSEDRRNRLSQDCSSRPPGSSRSSTSPRKSPRAQTRSLGTAYSAELFNTHLLSQAIKETIDFDKRGISARAEDGISPSFNRLPERQAYREQPSSQVECIQDRKCQLAYDCAPKRRSLGNSTDSCRSAKPGSRSPRLEHRNLGSAYTAELLEGEVLKEAIKCTIDMDKRYISSRVADGISASFNRFPERQAFSEYPSSQWEITEERRLQLLQDSSKASSSRDSSLLSAANLSQAQSQLTGAPWPVLNGKDSLRLTRQGSPRKGGSDPNKLPAWMRPVVSPRRARHSLDSSPPRELSSSRSEIDSFLQSPLRSDPDGMVVMEFSPQDRTRRNSSPLRKPAPVPVSPSRKQVNWREPKEFVAMVEKDTDARLRAQPLAEHGVSRYEARRSLGENRDFLTDMLQPGVKSSPSRTPRTAHREIVIHEYSAALHHIGTNRPRAISEEPDNDAIWAKPEAFQPDPLPSSSSWQAININGTTTSEVSTTTSEVPTMHSRNDETIWSTMSSLVSDESQTQPTARERVEMLVHERSRPGPSRSSPSSATGGQQSRSASPQPNNGESAQRSPTRRAPGRTSPERADGADRSPSPPNSAFMLAFRQFYSAPNPN